MLYHIRHNFVCLNFRNFIYRFFINEICFCNCKQSEFGSDTGNIGVWSGFKLFAYAIPIAISKMTFKFFFDDFRNRTYGIDNIEFYRKTMLIFNQNISLSKLYLSRSKQNGCGNWDKKLGIFLTWCFGKKSCHCVLFTISRIRFTG